MKGWNTGNDKLVKNATLPYAILQYRGFSLFSISAVVCDYSGPQAVMGCSIGCGLIESIILFLPCYKLENVFEGK